MEYLLSAKIRYFLGNYEFKIATMTDSSRVFMDISIPIVIKRKKFYPVLDPLVITDSYCV